VLPILSVSPIHRCNPHPLPILKISRPFRSHLERCQNEREAQPPQWLGPPRLSDALLHRRSWLAPWTLSLATAIGALSLVAAVFSLVIAWTNLLREYIEMVVDVIVVVANMVGGVVST
jgi:hypothetical protein